MEDSGYYDYGYDPYSYDPYGGVDYGGDVGTGIDYVPSVGVDYGGGYVPGDVSTVPMIPDISAEIPGVSTIPNDPWAGGIPEVPTDGSWYIPTEVPTVPIYPGTDYPAPDPGSVTDLGMP